jgi:hypothetical protein
MNHDRFRLSAIVLVSAALLALHACSAGEPPTVDTRTVVSTLASENFEGRLTGSEGSQKAADYIISELERIGANPVPGADRYLLPFQFTAGVADGGSRLTVTLPHGEAKTWDDRDSVQALSFSDTGTVSGPLVFAGYGLKVPETDGFSYDSYATLDVKDKIVLVLRYFPEDVDRDVRATLSRYAGLRYKAFAARERGAKGLIVVTGPRSPNAGALVPMTFDTAIGGAGLLASSVTGAVADVIFAHAPGKTLADVQAALDTGNPHVAGFDIPGVQVRLDGRVTREARTGHNVVGYLAPTAEPPTPLEEPYILLGAHYDHLGRGVGGNSLARKEETGQVHYGADDNASGVAAVLAVGARLAATERPRGVILAFWSGEELGLLGSAEFVKEPPVPVDQIAAYVNFDMVGRMKDNKLTVQAVGSSSIWTPLVEEVNKISAFDVQLVHDPYLPTDITSLNQAEVPSLGFFTGSHEDYHRPTDVASAINYTDLDRIAGFATAITERLLTRSDAPDFVKVEQTVLPAGQASLRIFTGTIPDYSTEAKGLLLSGVIGGGPAEKAGLKQGDVIVELAGQKVANIYDYTYALDVLKVGEPAKVVYMRGGQRFETEIIPQARQ